MGIPSLCNYLIDTPADAVEREHCDDVDVEDAEEAAEARKDVRPLDGDGRLE